MANKKITDLTALTAPAATDVLPIIDQSESSASDKNKKIAYSVLLTNVPSGSASTPSIAFSGDSNTGLAANGADGIQFVTGGAPRLLVADTGITIPGNLEVQGTTTTIDTSTLTVTDKNIEIAKGNGNDAAVDGAGITIDSTDGDKTWNWVDSTDAWTSSENIDLASGKVLKVAGTQVLSATQYTGNAATATTVTNVTVSANNSTDETVYPLFVDGATGAQGAETDTGLNYNPSTGNLTSTLFTGNLTGNVTGNTSGSAGSCTGNAATATALETARTIGGVSFDGTASINLPGVNQAGTQNTTGSAATLTTARTIGGVSFDGSANIDLPGVNAAGSQNTSGTAAGLSGTPNITVTDVVAASLDISGNADIDGTLETDALTIDGTALNEYIADTVGAMVSGNTESDITVVYQDADNTLDFTVGNISGTAGGLTGTPNITVADVIAASLDISGNADIDGTLEADAYTVNGTALNEYIADTVGAMVSSNTETNITVTYEDSDNTLDFVIGTLNQNTTGTAGGLSGTPNITVGDVVAASLDISGGADIDGTLEADAYTVDGVALNEYIADTIGAMVGSNTETGITVTYEDSDNTLDFVIGTLNQNTTGTAGGLSGTPNITVGDVVAASLDISGSADIDGTLEADAITVDGTALNEYIADTVGAMVSSNTETNITVTYEDSDNTLDFVIGTLNQDTTGSAATLTTARTIGGVSFDGSANIDLPGVNTAGNQNTSGTSAGLTGTPNITVGDVVAASLDISGNVDVDGTLETDALTINGTSLAETIADTVGAMVGSNTETGITVTYEDSDNTLDFVIGTLNQDTTGNAATATALETARTIGGTSFDGTANITPANATNAVNVTGTIASAVTGTTQSAADNSTKIATTAYVETAVSNLVDSAPGTLNTLNELAAALGDDASFSTTVTNSIATKLPLAGGELTGNITFSGSQTVDGRDVSADGTKLDGIEASADVTDATNVNAAGAVMNSDLDGKGELLVGDGSGDPTALAVGTNGYILTADSSEATGVKWAANAGSGGGGTAADITVADESSDTTCFPLFVTAATGDLEAKSGTNLTFNSSSGALTATSFVGALTGNVTGNTSGSSGSCTGNAATATALATARTIGGISFDGTANINLPGVNATGDQDTTGNATTATTATTATNFTVSANNSTDETVYPVFVDGATGGQGAETDTGLTYNPSSGLLTSTSFSGNLTGNVTGNTSGSSGSCTGNAATATTLATARNIGGVSFDGSAAIDLPGVNTAGNQNTTGSAATLTTARTIGGVSFDGSANIDLPGVNAAGNQNTTGNAATATTSGHVTVTDNESTNENNLIPFVEDAATSTGSHGLEMDGDFHYNPSTGTVTATAFAGSGANLTGIASTSLDGCGYQNDQTISAGTYTIAANKGMHSVGPITNNGTVTVNGTWVIS